MDEVERIAHERRPKLILAGWSGLPALPGLRALPRDRRRGRRDTCMVDMAHFAGLVAAGLHPNPVPLRRRRHLDGAQDPRRRARRAHPLPRGVRQGDQLGRLPGPAGRPARARHRRQGGRASASRRPSAFRERQQRTVAGAKALAEALLKAGHGVNVLTGGTDVHLVARRPARVRARRPAGRGPPARGRHHRQPQRRPVRPAPADGHQRPARRRQRPGDPRPAGRGLRRGRRHHRHGADAGLRGAARPSWPSASRRSPSATRSTSTSVRRPLRRSPAAPAP